MPKNLYEFVMAIRTPLKVITAELSKNVFAEGTKTVIGKRPPKKMRFVNGVFKTTDPKEAEFLKRHPGFNSDSPSKRFTLVTAATETAVNKVKTAQAPALAVGYEHLTEPYLKRLCEERKVKSYGGRAKMIAALEESDADAIDGGAQAALEADIARVCKKYTKQELADVAADRGVEVSMSDTESVMAETMLMAGIEL